MRNPVNRENAPMIQFMLRRLARLTENTGLDNDGPSCVMLVLCVFLLLLSKAQSLFVNIIGKL